MQTEDAVRRWIDTWLRAWPDEDVEALAAIYASGAPYRSHPFRDLDTARTYTTRAFDEETLVQAWFGEPVADGDRAAVEWWAILRDGENELTIAGASVLRFDPEGLVVEQRDYWDQREGRADPPPGWGR